MNLWAHWNTLKDRNHPFQAGWAWIVTGFIMALIGCTPLLLYIGVESLSGSSGGNSIGLGLLAMAGVGLGQFCLLVAILFISYGIVRRLLSSHT